MGIEISDVILGTTFLVIGAYASYYFSNRRKVSWIYTRRRVLDPVRSRYPDGLDISFEGRKIENLVEWKIAVWNDGNIGIKADDFLGLPQVRINFSSDKVLRFTEPVRSRDVIGGEIEPSESQIIIQDLIVLDRSDWLVFDVYTSSEVNDKDISSNLIEISADIMHLPKGIMQSKNSYFGSWKKKIFPLTAAIAYAAMTYSSAKKLFSEASNVKGGEIFADISLYLPEKYAIIMTYSSMFIFGIFIILFAIFAMFMVAVVISSFISAPPPAVQKIINKNNWPLLSFSLKRILQ